MQETEKQETEKDLVTACFPYWVRPRRPKLLRDEGNGGSRKPEYLKKTLVEQLIELVYSPSTPEELIITPPLDKLGQDVMELVVEYRGTQEYPTKVHVTLDETFEQPWRKYQVTVTGTLRAYQAAINKIKDALSGGELKDFGRAGRIPDFD